MANNVENKIEIISRDTGAVEVVDNVEELAQALQIVERNSFEPVARIDSELRTLKQGEFIDGVFCGVVELDGQWGKYKVVRLLWNNSGVIEFALLSGIQLVSQIEKMGLVVNKTAIRIQSVGIEKGENGTYTKYAIYLLKEKKGGKENE